MKLKSKHRLANVTCKTCDREQQAKSCHCHNKKTAERQSLEYWMQFSNLQTQCCSSEKSKQSLSPSHFHAAGMQRLFLQVNCDGEHVLVTENGNMEKKDRYNQKPHFL